MPPGSCTLHFELQLIGEAMGKKSVAYKRRLRRLQQRRKREMVAHKDTEQPRVEHKDNDWPSVELSHLDPVVSAAGNKSSQPDMEIMTTENRSAALVEQEGLQEECLELKKRLERYSQYYKYKLEVSETKYRNKLRICERKLSNTEQECNKRIRQVRSFWIDQIYKEGSRPGKLLKKAMQRCEK